MTSPMCYIHIYIYIYIYICYFVFVCIFCILWCRGCNIYSTNRRVFGFSHISFEGSRLCCLICRCIYWRCGLTLHCKPTLQTPSADHSLQTADIHCRPPLQTSIADPGCTHYLANLFCRFALPSTDHLSALFFLGGPSHNPFYALAFWGGPGPHSFPLPWPFGGGSGPQSFPLPWPFRGEGGSIQETLALAHIL